MTQTHLENLEGAIGYFRYYFQSNMPPPILPLKNTKPATRAGL